MNTARPSRGRAIAIAGLLVCCTVLGLAGTDLVLPAVPGLPAALGGNIEQAQLVLATFAAGTGVGLLLFGELGARLSQGRMLVGALLAYALLSAAAGASSSLSLLIALRFLQGVAASCAAVVTPGMVRALFDEQGAIKALGALGSLESLAPAIAPIIGVWLLNQYGWTASFQVTAVLALCLAVLVALALRVIPRVQGNRSRLGYWVLLRSRMFQRYALTQGLSLGSLLAFVFAMPTIFVVALGGEMRDFIIMQVLGISCFILAANLSSKMVQRYGVEATIMGGSLLSEVSCVALLCYAALGEPQVWVIWLLFMPFNFGFGFRGPPGFYRALQASGGDDARASALVVLYVMLITAAATASLAPFVTQGLLPAALVATLLGAAGIALLLLMPPMRED